jgi:hypothetical protein
MSNIYFILPDVNNLITANDIKSGRLRITVNFKSYFSSVIDRITLRIGELTYEAKYRHQSGRSDLLFIGRRGIDALNLKPGDQLLITKLSNLSFQIERKSLTVL